MTPFSESTILIPLDKGQTAIVDADQYELVKDITWHAEWNPRSLTYYAGGNTAETRPGRTNKYRSVAMHRVLCGVLNDPSLIVHHRDGNGLNNVRENLHPCTLFEHSRFYERKPGRDRTPPHVKAGWNSRLKRVSDEELAVYKTMYPAGVEYGTCWCGCGRVAPLCKATNRAEHHFRGLPRPYIFGHQTKGKVGHNAGKTVNHKNLHPFKYRDGRPKYKVNEQTGCWDWIGPLDTTGAGSTCLTYRKKDRAYRVSWMLHNKVTSIPKGFVVDHICRRRCCVNPLHLQLITQADNARRGKNGKLSQSDADHIRFLYGEGRMTMQEIADGYGVHPAHVSRVVAGQMWGESPTCSVSRHERALRRKPSKNGTGFRGVSTKKGRYSYSPVRYAARIQMTIDGVRRTEELGCFPLPEEAARAWDKRMYELFGDKVRLNFPIQR